jgi:predicted enzyme related to lactoylglutathione lyase
VPTMSETQGIQTVLHPTSDVEKAKAVYVGFEAAGQQIGLVPNSQDTSPVAYWHVADIEAKLADVTAAGATVKEAPRDVGGGRLVATLTDTDGNVLGLIQDR